MMPLPHPELAETGRRLFYFGLLPVLAVLIVGVPFLRLLLDHMVDRIEKRDRRQ